MSGRVVSVVVVFKGCGLEISERPVEVSDLWALHQATARATTRYFGLRADGAVSVFKGDAVPGPLWASCTPLERCSNNLLKYRHPCILRYITAWQQRSTLHLATESATPLAQALPAQAPLQICVGLNDILRALVFLHEQAGTSHNDVSISSVYVTPDGHWKLAGLQYLCAFKELTPSYLKHARLHRYDKAVDPNEDTQEVVTKVDQYAFAVLVEDVFKGRKDDDVPHLKDFKQYCRERLQHQNPLQRPPLSEVLQHKFFNHQFISIYKFLYFLPLKSEEEKAEFFSTILEHLRGFEDETVAKQLGGLLLSRLAMLDQTARKEVIPYVLTPRNERTSSDERRGLFSLSVYKEHIKPSVVQLFGVHDSQIRLLLLAHFPKYAHVFTHEELSQHILPELLLGIKDTDDNLVASTLTCLAELIPILGASTVIGGKRSKIFNDGRPNQQPSSHSKSHNGATPPKPLKDFTCSEEISEEIQFENKLILNERPSPVGGECNDEEPMQFTKEVNNVTVTESEETWSDWDASNRQTTTLTEFAPVNIIDEHQPVKAISRQEQSISSKARTALLQNAAIEAKKKLIDISELDIKTQTVGSFKKSGGDQFDFFADMAPVIEKTAAVVVSESEVGAVSSKLNFVPSETADESNTGWGDDWSDS